MKKSMQFFLQSFIDRCLSDSFVRRRDESLLPANTEDDAGISDLTDGEYAIDVTMTGGSGKATIKVRPCSLSMMESPMLPSPGAVPIMTI